MINLLNIVLALLALIIAVVLHEIAHGYMAYLAGDDTAKKMGRLSLNPLIHIDPVGSLLLPAILFFLHMPIIGWAKPVPVDFTKFNHHRRNVILVSLAGVTMNFSLALTASLINRLIHFDLLNLFLLYLIMYNIYRYVGDIS